MNLELKDKVIMVAAASKGLGLGIARSVAEEGARVSIASRTEADIKETALVLTEETGAQVSGFTFDASDSQSIIEWTAATEEEFGAIDGLAVNAGGPAPGKFADLDDTAWQNGFELTLMSTVRMIRAVVPSMQEQGGGSIITVTSTSIKEPIDVLLLSNVLRAGVTSLVKCLSKDLAPDNIRINNLVPGRIDTARVRELDAINAEKEGISVEEQSRTQQIDIPLGRYGNIDEFGKAAAFLLSDCASYITGSMLLVDGGKTHAVW